MRLALYLLIFLGTIVLVLDLMKEVKTIKAPEKLEPTKRIDPASPEVSNQQAPHNAGHPDVVTALKLYTKAIENAPDKAKPYIDRANAYIANRQFAEALTDLNKAVELEPKNTNALLQRGAHFLRMKEEDKAISDFSQAHKIDPSFIKALIYRGITHFQREEFQPALDDFLLILKKDPTFADLHLSIAQCYHGLGQTDKAQQHLKLYRISTKDPKGSQKADALEKEWSKTK